MGRNELVSANNREIQDTYEGNHSIREIAQKIIDDPRYIDEVEKIVPIFINISGENGWWFRLLIQERTQVYKGIELGEYGDGEYAISSTDYVSWTGGKRLTAPCDGIFIPNDTNFELKSTSKGSMLIWFFYKEQYRIHETKIDIGKIYHNDYPFYIKNKNKIQKEVSVIQKERQEAVKIAKEQKEEEKQRKAKKLQDDIEKINKPLMDLEKYTLKHELPLTTTIDVIDQELSYVYNQKDSINDLKPIADYESRFENIYIESKKNKNLDNITEGRMLNTLRRLFEILGESNNRIEKLLSDIQNSGEDEKFSILFKEQVDSINNATSSLKATFESEKKLDSAKLTTIENLSIYFSENKDKIGQKKNLEVSKEILEYIWKEYSKIESKSSTYEDSLKRIMKNIYETFGMSVEQINEIFTKQTIEENQRKFEIELNRIKQKVNDPIIKLQNVIANKKFVDFSQFSLIEESFFPLLEQKDKIKDLSYFESCKSKIESIYDEYQKQENKSETASKQIISILDMLYAILDYTEEQKQEVVRARELLVQKENIKSLTSKIRELEILSENREQSKTEILQNMQSIEDLLKELVEQKDIIEDKSELERDKTIFEAILKDSKKWKDFSNSAKLRMQGIANGFNEICGKGKKGFFHK